ncbi:MAG: 30S ribosomal protein S9, partial [Candidatus Aenigmatarchaeota archaeon]
MVTKLPKIVHEVGKRKTAVARVTFKLKERENSELKIRINSYPLNVWGTETLRWRIREVFMISEDYIKDILPKYEIKVNVKGGGLVSQADAIRQAIAKALLRIVRNKKLEELFHSFDPWLLKRDY